MAGTVVGLGDERSGGSRLVLSASSVATFLRCGQQWFYAYVANVKSPPSLKQALGLTFHEAVEGNMQQKVSSTVDLPLDDVLDIFSTSWDALEPEIEPKEDEDPKKAKDSGVQLVRKQHLEVAPAIQPVMVEEPVSFEINGLPYSGTIDLVDSKSRVRDWKTSSRTPSKGTSHLLAMTGYALAYRQKTGEMESEVVLDYLIRTKEPKYLPIASGGPIDGKTVVKFAQVVSDVHQQIEAGRFLPNGLMSNACSWCGYTAMCPYFKEYRS